MKLSGAALIVFFLFFNSFAQYNPGAKQISLSHSDIASAKDPFCVFNNPAGLAGVNFREAAVYYSPFPFGFRELASGSAAYTEPLPFGTAAIGAMIYGFDLYKEIYLQGGISFKYDNLSAGIAFSLRQVSIKNYGTDLALCINPGIILNINSLIKWGAVFYNINRATYGKSDGQIPVALSSGISMEPFPTITLNAAFEKELAYKPSILIGAEFRPVNYICIRSGFSTEPDRFSAGIGIFYSIFNIDYAFFTHPFLGLTHQAGLIISFGENQE